MCDATLFRTLQGSWQYPVALAPTLEERIDDIRAVMDAAASQRAAIIGYAEGGAIAALFAAAHPDRAAALVMYETWVCALIDPVQNHASGDRSDDTCRPYTVGRQQRSSL